MALQPALTSYVRKISVNNVRYFAAAAAAKPKDSSGGHSNYSAGIIESVRISSSGNLPVATIERNRPLAKIAVYYRAGSRHENDDNIGVVHALRMAAGKGTAGVSCFGITRNVEQHGGILTCTAGREYIAYAIEAPRNEIGSMQQILIDVASKQVFKPWELEETHQYMKEEKIVLAPETRALELLHKAAFRRGLGYSLYSPKCKIGKHSQETLQDFVKNNFVEATVVGLGIDSDNVERIARRIKVQGKAREVIPSKFHAHEIRKDLSGDLTYVAVGISGAGIENHKEFVAAALAQRALGSGPRTKRGNMAGKLGTANTDSSVASAINLSYSDAGIIGALVVATSTAIGNATKRVIETLKTASFTEDEVRRAKAVLKADLAYALESEVELLDDVALQILFNGRVADPIDINQLVDSVTSADVNAIVKKGGGKLAIAAVGNLSKLPYLDEL